jgi:hypothetical protein
VVVSNNSVSNSSVSYNNVSNNSVSNNGPGGGWVPLLTAVAAAGVQKRQAQAFDESARSLSAGCEDFLLENTANLCDVVIHFSGSCLSSCGLSLVCSSAN